MINLIPDISIIIPIYNSEKYLHRCIQSVINQTFKNIEIILINDGSTDNSINICNEFKKIDNRIIFESQENKGVSSARNLGMNIASGEYIAFVDSDDWIEEKFCEISYQSINNKKYDLLIFNPYEHKGEEIDIIENFFEKKREFLSDNSELVKMLLNPKVYKRKNHNIIIGGPVCKLYRRNFIKENNIKFNTNISIHEDDIFNIQFIGQCKNILYINENLYHIFRNNDSSTRRYMPGAIDNIKNTIYTYKDVINKLTYSDECWESFNEKIIGLFIILNSVYFSHKDNKKSIVDLYKEIKKFSTEKFFIQALNKSRIKHLDKKRIITLYLLKNNFYFTFLLLAKLNKYIK